MCWFKKKEKKQPINSKFKKGEFVNFRYKDELSFGWIWSSYQKDINGIPTVFYDIQIGGQCPAVINGIPENKILGIKKD